MSVKGDLKILKGRLTCTTWREQENQHLPMMWLALSTQRTFEAGSRGAVLLTTDNI